MEKFITKHTPWPWEIGDENNASFEVMIGDTTCSIDRSHRHTGKYIISRDEMIANGHLIYAAPLLLSALIGLISCCEENPSVPGQWWSKMVPKNEQLNRAKAAIVAAGVVVEESKSENQES